MSKPTESPQTNKNQLNSFIETLQEKSDIPITYLLSCLGITLILSFFGLLDIHLTNIVSVILPAYWTMRCYDRADKEEEKQWITYWFFWAFLFLLDLLIPFYMKMIPHYYFVKLLFLTWLYLPNTRGALYLYNNIFIKAGPFDLTKLSRFTKKFSLIKNLFLDKFFNSKKHEGVSHKHSDQKSIGKKMPQELISHGEMKSEKLEEIPQKSYGDKISDLREKLYDNRGEKIPIDEKYGREEEVIGATGRDIEEERIITPHCDRVIYHQDKVMDLNQNLKDNIGKEKYSTEKDGDGHQKRKIL